MPRRAGAWGFALGALLAAACSGPPVGPVDAGAADAAAGDGAAPPADARPDLRPADAAASPDGGPDGLHDAGDDAGAAARDPVILVHGINGSSADFAVMYQRLLDDGYPTDFVRLVDFPDPSWGCNVDNAALLAQVVQQVLAATGRSRVDLVAHSMGGLSSRYYLKNLGGAAWVNTFVTLGTMHHGLGSPCLSPVKPCVWAELCATGAFIAQLNAAPATPGELRWVSFYGTADETVPNDSSYLEGAENLAFPGVEHDGANGLQQVDAVYQEVVRVLAYPAW